MPLEPAAADAADTALRAVLGGGPWRWQALHASGFTATWSATRDGERLFVKTLPGEPARADAGAAGGMLAAEADGLAALAATRTIRVPAVAAFVPAADGRPALLALEWLDLAPPDAGFGARFGVALAALHRAPVDPPRYGWPRDNFLGATPQRNTPTAGAAPDDWLGFVAHCRLRAMVDGLRRTDADAHAGPARPQLVGAVDAVIDALPRLLDGPHGAHRPRPSLIHGDLWGGNWGMLADGTPVVFDPAVSWSDAEAELAMMELFGTPPPAFWRAYRDAAGLHADYPRRRGVYQLVHLLNHARLFGGSYARQALACAQSVLRVARGA
jgi:protein-ribulosamine 3-kinase